MKNTIWLFFILIGGFQLQAQNRTLKKTTTLQMPRTAEDDMPGTRGASVTWHPVQKKYYAAMAGNALYPLAIFDAAGERISGVIQNCYFDVRGLWYNPIKKQIEGNGYGETGWFTYKLNKSGMIDDSVTIKSGMVQPNEQCVGAFNSATKEVLFLDNSTVYAYAQDGSVSGNIITLQWGIKKGEQPNEYPLAQVPDGYNYTTIVYTGIANAEIGVLNTDKRQVELYNAKNGLMTSVLTLPADISLELNFNFSFCNNMYWFFDIENRTWIGCK